MKTETKQKLIEVGAEAVMAKSFDGVGINQVLELAGVPKGSFYHHFKSKEEFGVAVVNHTAEEHEQRLKDHLLQGDGSPLERLRAFFEFGRDYHRENGTERKCLVAKMALDHANLSDPIQSCVKRGFDSWRNVVAQCLEQAKEAGELEEGEDTVRLADFLNSAWEGVMVRMQVDRDLTVVDSFIELVFERVLVRKG